MQHESVSKTDSAAIAEASPLCCELRTKRYYYLDRLPTTAEEILDDSNRCWCRLTMQALGPDSDRVHPDSCKPGRSCYRSAFDIR